MLLEDLKTKHVFEVLTTCKKAFLIKNLLTDYVFYASLIDDNHIKSLITNEIYPIKMLAGSFGAPGYLLTSEGDYLITSDDLKLMVRG